MAIALGNEIVSTRLVHGDARRAQELVVTLIDHHDRAEERGAATRPAAAQASSNEVRRKCCRVLRIYGNLEAPTAAGAGVADSSLAGWGRGCSGSTGRQAEEDEGDKGRRHFWWTSFYRAHSSTSNHG